MNPLYLVQGTDCQTAGCLDPRARTLFRMMHHRGTKGEGKTIEASVFATIMMGLNLTSCKLRLFCFPLCSLWLCGGSPGFVHHAALFATQDRH
jgi:hypothetical protein